MAPGSRLDLAKCHRLLVSTFSAEEVPSIVTLRRHAAAGLLDHCLAAGKGVPGRPRYLWAKIKEHYQPRPRPQPATCESEVGGYSDQQLERVLAGLLAPVLAQLADCTRQVAALPAIRNALMTKYDAAASAALVRADSLTRETQELRRLLDLDTSLRKLAASVARLAESAARDA